MSTDHRSRKALKLVQLTDTHLGEQPGTPLLGLDTDLSFGHVIERVRQDHPNLDLLLATGDLSDQGSLAAYRRFMALTDNLAQSSLWLPGNHDIPSMMHEVAVGQMAGSKELAGWRIIMLDSSVAGKVSGELQAEQLDFLEQQLQQSAAAGQHVLVSLHHQPVPVGCAWLDQQSVADAGDFFTILDQFSHVRAVLWGHVHQQFESERRGVQLLASPSTCVQFAANSDDFKLDRQAPGFRWLDLHSNGRIESGVTRISDVAFDIDYDITEGY